MWWLSLLFLLFTGTLVTGDVCDESDGYKVGSTAVSVTQEVTEYVQETDTLTLGFEIPNRYIVQSILFNGFVSDYEAEDPIWSSFDVLATTGRTCLQGYQMTSIFQDLLSGGLETYVDTNAMVFGFTVQALEEVVTSDFSYNRTNHFAVYVAIDLETSKTVNSTTFIIYIDETDAQEIISFVEIDQTTLYEAHVETFFTTAVDWPWRSRVKTETWFSASSSFNVQNVTIEEVTSVDEVCPADGNQGDICAQKFKFGFNVYGDDTDSVARRLLRFLEESRRNLQDEAQTIDVHMEAYYEDDTEDFTVGMAFDISVTDPSVPIDENPTVINIGSASLTGTLASYTDGLFLNPTKSFMLGDVVFLEATFATPATVIGMDITNLTIIQSSQTFVEPNLDASLIGYDDLAKNPAEKTYRFRLELRDPYIIGGTTGENTIVSVSFALQFETSDGRRVLSDVHTVTNLYNTISVETVCDEGELKEEPCGDSEYQIILYICEGYDWAVFHNQCEPDTEIDDKDIHEYSAAVTQDTTGTTASPWLISSLALLGTITIVGTGYFIFQRQHKPKDAFYIPA